MRPARPSRIVYLSLVGWLATTPAGAVDGVIEINQASALAGGITACDTPGFPVTICTPGAYRLTSNLDYPSTTANAIIAEAEDVSIDLNGMTVSGATTCTTGANGWVTSCSQQSGITAIVGSVRTVVAHGRIKGSGGTGIFALDASEFRDLQVTDCTNAGISAGNRSVLIDVEAIGNGITGISAGEGSRISGAIATNNGSDGVVQGASSVAEGVVSQRNGNRGVVVFAGAHLRNFSAFANGAAGVRVLDGGLVESGSIRSNSVTNASACGVEGQGGAAYRSVVITGAAGGNSITACGMVNLGNNSCQGGVCPP